MGNRRPLSERRRAPQAGGGHGGGWGNPARWGWGGGFVDPDIVVEDGAQTPFALPGFGPFGTGTPGPYGFGTTATAARLPRTIGRFASPLKYTKRSMNAFISAVGPYQ